ncbi:MAG: hypothetical protein M1542_08320 [Thermotogae bacterium]|jgi:hypothetical protein|nr:hypothetical protein [Thermotogota bacterium]MCL5033232.1 hypothetical protein [Thermotogota bacterium]
MKNPTKKVDLQVDLNCDMIALLETAERLFIEGDYHGIFFILKELHDKTIKANDLWKEETNYENENSESVITNAEGRGLGDSWKARKTDDVYSSQTSYQETFQFNDSTKIDRHDEEMISNEE